MTFGFGKTLWMEHYNFEVIKGFLTFSGILKIWYYKVIGFGK